MKERIKELRTHLGLTQQKFADKLGLKRQTIAAYEIGNIEPSDSTLLLICKEFNISEDWLRTGQGEMIEDTDLTYGAICAQISVTDEKAKKAIIDYWNLTPQDKELVWKFMERFFKSGNSQ